MPFLFCFKLKKKASRPLTQSIAHFFLLLSKRFIHSDVQCSSVVLVVLLLCTFNQPILVGIFLLGIHGKI